MEPTKYEKAKISEGLNPHVKRSIILYCIFSGVALSVAAVIDLLVVPIFCPNDPGVVTRTLVEKTIRFVFAIFLATGAMIYYEIKAKGNLLGQVLQSPMACSVFLSTVFFGVVLLLLWV